MIDTLLTFSTKEHQPLLDRFKKGRINEYHLKVVGQDITNPAVDYMGVGWNILMRMKIQAIVDECLGEGAYIYADSDVVFLKDSKSYFEGILNGIDLAFQVDDSHLCAGLMVIKRCKNNYEFFKAMSKEMEGRDIQDQALLNEWHEKLKLYRIPKAVAANYNSLTGDTLWNGQQFQIPQDTITFHANWCIGVEKKCKLMDQVLQGVNNG